MFQPNYFIGGRHLSESKRIPKNATSTVHLSTVQQCICLLLAACWNSIYLNIEIPLLSPNKFIKCLHILDIYTNLKIGSATLGYIHFKENLMPYTCPLPTYDTF